MIDEQGRSLTTKNKLEFDSIKTKTNIFRFIRQYLIKVSHLYFTVILKH